MADAPTATLSAIHRLTDVSRALTYAASLDEVFTLAVDCAVDLLHAEKALLLTLDDDALLQVRAFRGMEKEAVDRFRGPLDETLAARLADLLGAGLGERFVAVPLVVRGRVTGLVAVERRIHRPVSDADEWLLSALADQTAVAIENARQEELRGSLESRLGELERVGDRKDRALQMISHDLRSPLNAIQGYVELMRAELMGPLTEKQRETLERIRSIGRHLASLMDNVVELSYLSRENLGLAIRATNPREVAIEAAQILGPASDEAKIRIEVEGGDGLHVQADPDRLRQILVHLIDNAVKYGPDGSTVRVSVRRAEREPVVIIAVSDEGPGIPADRLERIFEPYERGSGSGARSVGGLGLGLAIARGLAQAMGGDLRVESQEGEGATFALRLPLSREEDVPAAGKPEGDPT